LNGPHHSKVDIESELAKLEKRDKKRKRSSSGEADEDGVKRSIKRAERKRRGAARRYATTKYSRSRSGSGENRRKGSNSSSSERSSSDEY